LKTNTNIDFTAEIDGLDQSKIKNRMNSFSRSYEVPEKYKLTPKPLNLMGDIIRIDQILKDPEQYFDKCVFVAGWAKTTRDAEKKQIAFIELNDGSQ